MIVLLSLGGLLLAAQLFVSVRSLVTGRHDLDPMGTWSMYGKTVSDYSCELTLHTAEGERIVLTRACNHFFTHLGQNCLFTHDAHPQISETFLAAFLDHVCAHVLTIEGVDEAKAANARIELEYTADISGRVASYHLEQRCEP